MASNRTSPLEDLVVVVSKLPWWGGMTLGLVSYVVMHSIAVRPLPVVAPGPGALGAAASASMFRTLAFFGQFILPFVCGIAAVISFVNAARQKQLYENTASRTGVSALNDLTWQEFEMLVCEYYRRRGFQVSRVGGNGPDGGVDLIMKQASETHLVQCKQWKAYKVGVQPVREFYGVMAARGAAGGYFVTSGEYTEDAENFARGLNLELIDGKSLSAMIDAVRSQVASAGQSTRFHQTAKTPPCPKCGAEMTRRVARQGRNAGKEFWGCNSYPACTGTLPIDGSPQAEAVTRIAETKNCPDCGTEMVLRQFQSGPRSGQQFYGCSACKKGWPVGG